MAFGITCPKCGKKESTPGCFVCDPQPKKQKPFEAPVDALLAKAIGALHACCKEDCVVAERAGAYEVIAEYERLALTLGEE